MVMLKCVCLSWGHIPRIHFWRPPWGRNTNSLGLIFFYLHSLFHLSVRTELRSIARDLYYSRELSFCFARAFAVCASAREDICRRSRIFAWSRACKHKLARVPAFSRARLSVCSLNMHSLARSSVRKVVLNWVYSDFVDTNWHSVFCLDCFNLFFAQPNSLFAGRTRRHLETFIPDNANSLLAGRSQRPFVEDIFKLN